MRMKNKGGGSRSRQKDLSDHNSGLTPVKGEKEGRRVMSENLDHSRVLRMVWLGWWGVDKERLPIEEIPFGTLMACISHLSFYGQSLSGSSFVQVWPRHEYHIISEGVAPGRCQSTALHIAGSLKGRAGCSSMLQLQGNPNVTECWLVISIVRIME